MQIEDLVEGQRIKFTDDYQVQILKKYEAYKGDKGEITCINEKILMCNKDSLSAWVKLDNGRFVYLLGELPVRVLNEER